MRLMSCAALGLAATLFTAPALIAQTSFSVAAGAAVPIGSTADAMKVGYNVTAALGIKPPVAPIGLRIDGMYNSMDGKVSGSGTSRILGGTANVTLSGAGSPIPLGYIIGGVGMYNMGVSGAAVSVKSENKFGFNVGAGIKFPLTGFSTFAEARLHIVNTAGKSTKFAPITFGITF